VTDAMPDPGISVEALDDSAIRRAVARLARPHPSGGDVVERAAILAEGMQAQAILAWIAAHDGVPEAAAPRSTGRGLHGTPRGDSGATQSSKPARYILPSGAVERPE